MQEAVEWARKCPEGCGVLEVRRIAEMEDFGEALGEEGRKREAEMREQMEKLARGEFGKVVLLISRLSLCFIEVGIAMSTNVNRINSIPEVALPVPFLPQE